MIYLIMQFFFSLILALIVGGALGWILHRTRNTGQAKKWRQAVMQQQHQLKQAHAEVAMVTDDYNELKIRSAAEIDALRNENTQISSLDQNLEKSQALVQQLLRKNETKVRELTLANESLSAKIKLLGDREQLIQKLQLDLEAERRVQGRSNATPAHLAPEPAEDFSDLDETLATFTIDHSDLLDGPLGDPLLDSPEYTHPDTRASHSRDQDERPSFLLKTQPNVRASASTVSASPVSDAAPYKFDIRSANPRVAHHDNTDTARNNAYTAPSATSPNTEQYINNTSRESITAPKTHPMPPRSATQSQPVTEKGQSVAETVAERRAQAATHYGAKTRPVLVPSATPAPGVAPQHAPRIMTREKTQTSPIPDKQPAKQQQQNSERRSAAPEIIRKPKPASKPAPTSQASLSTLEIDTEAGTELTEEQLLALRAQLAYDVTQGNDTTAAPQPAPIVASPSPTPQQATPAPASTGQNRPQSTRTRLTTSQLILQRSAQELNMGSADASEDEKVPSERKAANATKNNAQENSKAASTPKKRKNRGDRQLAKNIKPIFPRVEQRDDLQQIFGIGPVTEKSLNALGITSYSQLAELNRHDIDKIAEALQIFPTRIVNYNWVGSARQQLEEVLEGL